MGLAAAYRTKFIKQELIKRNQIRRGDILLGKYKSKRTGEVTNKVSFVLDWAPFKGNISERKLYVFDLDMLHPSLLKKLIKKIGGLEFTNTGTFTYHRVKIGMKPRDGGVIFNKYIKDFLQEVKGVWKTYSLVNYKQVKLCDYDYSGMFRELPPRTTIAEKLSEIDKDIPELKEGIANLEQMGVEGRIPEKDAELKQYYNELKSNEKQRDKLISRRAKGEMV